MYLTSLMGSSGSCLHVNTCMCNKIYLAKTENSPKKKLFTHFL